MTKEKVCEYCGQKCNTGCDEAQAGGFNRENMEETMVNLYRVNQGSNVGIPRLREKMKDMSDKELERCVWAQKEVAKIGA